MSYTPEPKTKTELQAEARAAGKKAGKAAPEKAAKSEPLAAPAQAGKFPDLNKTLDAIIAKAAEPGRKFKTIKPPAWATNPEPMPWAEEAPQEARGKEPRQEAASDPVLNARSDPKMTAARQAKAAGINVRDNSVRKFRTRIKTPEQTARSPSRKKKIAAILATRYWR